MSTPSALSAVITGIKSGDPETQAAVQGIRARARERSLERQRARRVAQEEAARELAEEFRIVGDAMRVDLERAAAALHVIRDALPAFRAAEPVLADLLRRAEHVKRSGGRIVVPEDFRLPITLHGISLLERAMREITE